MFHGPDPAQRPLRLSLLRFALVAALAGATPCAEPRAHSVSGSSERQACPCSVLPRNPNSKPATAAEGKPVELGMLFHANTSGFAGSVRFLKAPGARGIHSGHLWNAKGELVGSVTFRAESPSGWQEARFDPPVSLESGQDYVVSYFSPDGSYAFTPDFFGAELRTANVTVPPDAGRFLYSPRPGVPSTPYRGTNYWVDVVFTQTTPAEASLSVAPLFPKPGQSGVGVSPRIAATFSRRMIADTISPATVRLLDAHGKTVPSAVEYREPSPLLLLRPLQALAFDTTYTVQIDGGSSGPRDNSGNMLAQPARWTVTTGACPRAAENADSPVMVLTSAARPFSTYFPEILRAEGLNEFRTLEVERLSPAMLQGVTVAVLGEVPVPDREMNLLDAWVAEGGRLISMRPDARFDSFYGIRHRPATLPNAYFRVDTGRLPGAGLTSESMQFHGVSDTFTLAGASSLAALYADAIHSTEFPALTAFRHGAGMVFAFSFDLARSIVLTRQGNPDWSGMERDGIAPIRSDDLFYGDDGGAPSWVNFDKVQIPQADELQRLFANLIVESVRPAEPLPRFWYFPRGLKAVVVMTGDDHGKGNTVNRFENALAASAPGCSLEEWECVRGSAYLFPGSLTRDQAARYAADGFDIGVHVSTDCADWPSNGSSASAMASIYQKQLSRFGQDFPALSKPATSRTHCIAWGDYDTQPRVEFQLGIRLDTNYYYWPREWVRDRPGLFTGSGMPMLFAARTGSPIPVYQAATFLTDESGQSYPLHIDTLLDNALGPRGYYGAFTANMHADLPESPQADAIVASALAHNVPVISARQLLDWLQARDGSAFDDVSWSGGKLQFSVYQSAGSYGLEVMLPAQSGAGHLQSVTLGGHAVPFTLRRVKGIEYGVFPAAPGRFVADYRPNAAIARSSS